MGVIGAGFFVCNHMLLRSSVCLSDRQTPLHKVCTRGLRLPAVLFVLVYGIRLFKKAKEDKAVSSIIWVLSAAGYKI